MTDLFSSSADATDPLFRGYRDNELFEADRERLQAMWARFQPHADPHFLTEIRHHFVSRAWEMFVACALLEVGKVLDSSPKGPDFVVLKDGKPEVYIDAVAPSGGDGPDAVPDETPWVPQDGIILRLRSALEAKFRKFREDVDSGVAVRGVPQVVALTSWGMPLASLPSDPPWIIQTLFGVGRRFLEIDTRTSRTRLSAYPHVPEKIKRSGASVSTDIFVGAAYPEISAVLYGEAPRLGIPDRIAPQLIMAHNHGTSRPLPSGWMGEGAEIWFEDGEVRQRRCASNLGAHN
jgi:hypothetical protein